MRQTYWHIRGERDDREGSVGRRMMIRVMGNRYMIELYERKGNEGERMIKRSKRGKRIRTGVQGREEGRE